MAATRVELHVEQQRMARCWGAFFTAAVLIAAWSDLCGIAHGQLRIVTYNIHRGRGLDRRTRPERIAEVLQALDADVIALQEVIGPGRTSAGHAEIIGAALGMGWIMGPVRELRQHQSSRLCA